MDEGVQNREAEALKKVLLREDLAEKKGKIYSRLITDNTVSKAMEKISVRHGERLAQLAVFAGVKVGNKGEKNA